VGGGEYDAGMVDWDQISRGQEVFYRYGGAALTAVGTLSFTFPRFDHESPSTHFYCTWNIVVLVHV
jgi:hypothetical protein